MTCEDLAKLLKACAVSVEKLRRISQASSVPEELTFDPRTSGRHRLFSSTFKNCGHLLTWRTLSGSRISCSDRGRDMHRWFVRSMSGGPQMS